MLAAACAGIALLAVVVADDGEVDGEGYSYDVPDGWSDFTDEAEEEPVERFGGVRPDTLVGEDTGDFYATQVSVHTQEGVAGLKASDFATVYLEALRKRSAPGVRLTTASEPRVADLGGEKAAVTVFAVSWTGTNLRFRQFATVIDDTGYLVTLIALPENFDQGLDSLREFIDSWEWD